MAARRNTRNDNPPRSMPWGPMLLSFAVGAFVMFLLHLKDNVPVEKTNKAETEKASKSNTIKPTFDFYTLLPEMEVVVENEKAPKQPIVTSPTQQTEKSEQPQQNESYMLQVGSFKKMADADGFRARLAFLGIESKVQTVTIDNKETWHRVQVGPIKGRKQADALQKKLRENDIESLLMRAKHG